MDVSLLALAVVAVAVGPLDDARRALGAVPVPVSIAAVGLRGVKVQRRQDEGQEEDVDGDTLHPGLV